VANTAPASFNKHSMQPNNPMKFGILNSALVGICLAVSAWVGNKAAQSGEQLAAVATQLTAIKDAASKSERQMADGLARLERKLDETVTRREFDARILVVEAEQRKQDIRLREIDLEILKLKSRKEF
jgi:hypothetical protein